MFFARRLRFRGLLVVRNVQLTVLGSYEFSTNFAVILYLECQSDTNLSACFVHGKYVFFTNFTQIRLR